MRISELTVKRVFIFFLFYLVFQYLLVGLVGVLYSEPWPAFVLPGFKSVYATQNNIEITEPRIVALTSDSTRQPVDALDLFEGIPTSQLSGFLRSNFGNQIDFSSEAKYWFKQRLKQLFPDEKYSGLQIEWRQITYDKKEDNQITKKETSKIISIPFTK